MIAVLDRVLQKTAARSALPQLLDDLTQLTGRRHELHRQQAEARAALDGARRIEAKHWTKEELAQKAAKHEQTLQRLDAELDELQPRIERLQAEIERTRAEQQEPAVVSARDLTSAAKRFAEQTAEVERLQRLCEAQQAIIDQADPAPVAAARQQLAEALADAAEGRGDRAQVAAAERKVDAANKAHAENTQLAEQARITLQGLTPRLDRAREHLHELTAIRTDLLANYFRCEQQSAAERYRAAFRDLQSAYSTLAALSDELESVGAERYAHIGQDWQVPDPAGGKDWNLLDESAAAKVRQDYARRVQGLEG